MGRPSFRGSQSVTRNEFMLYPQLEQRLQASKQAVNSATSESIVKQSKEYLALLGEYRSQLYELQGTSGLNQQSASPSLSEGPDRKTIREAIERTTRERNRTQLLLLSFTTVSGYEAVEIFNRRNYGGHD